MVTWNMTKTWSCDKAPIGKDAHMLKGIAKVRSINRFEAKALHDQCLNSAFSTLQNNLAIVIDQCRESVPYVNDKASVSFNRYRPSTKPMNPKHIREILAGMSKLRKRK